jgi:diadenosine tetraphosphatase ApaH/serine/threonine PP2A family protein phosphatase
VTSAGIALESLAAIGTTHGLHGHTHVPVAFIVTEGDDDRMEIVGPGPDTMVSLGGRRTFLNPGSVGQPRDGDPTSSCLVLDTDRGTATWSRAAYDIDAVQRAMLAAKLPRRLADRLSVGA